MSKQIIPLHYREVLKAPTPLNCGEDFQNFMSETRINPQVLLYKCTRDFVRGVEAVHDIYLAWNDMTAGFEAICPKDPVELEDDAFIEVPAGYIRCMRKSLKIIKAAYDTLTATTYKMEEDRPSEQPPRIQEDLSPK